ncbi:hypothetical protein Efla_001497 [Eimeria flavescens]
MKHLLLQSLALLLHRWQEASSLPLVEGGRQRDSDMRQSVQRKLQLNAACESSSSSSSSSSRKAAGSSRRGLQFKSFFFSFEQQKTGQREAAAASLPLQHTASFLGSLWRRPNGGNSSAAGSWSSLFVHLFLLLPCLYSSSSLPYKMSLSTPTRVPALVLAGFRRGANVSSRPQQQQHQQNLLLLLLLVVQSSRCISAAAVDHPADSVEPEALEIWSATVTLDTSSIWGHQAYPQKLPSASAAAEGAAAAAAGKGAPVLDSSLLVGPVQAGRPHRKRRRLDGARKATAAAAAAAAVLLLSVSAARRKRATAETAGKAEEASTAAQAEDEAAAAKAEAAAEEAEAAAAAGEAASEEAAEPAAPEADMPYVREQVIAAGEDAAAEAAAPAAATTKDAAEVGAATAKLLHLESLASDVRRLSKIVSVEQVQGAIERIDEALQQARQEERLIRELQQQPGEEGKEKEEEASSEENLDLATERLDECYWVVVEEAQELLHVVEKALFVAVEAGSNQSRCIAESHTRLQMLSEQATRCFAPPRANPLQVHLLQAALTTQAAREEVSSLMSLAGRFQEVLRSNSSLSPGVQLKEAVAAAEAASALTFRMQKLFRNSMFWMEDGMAVVRAAARSATSGCVFQVAALQVELEVTRFRLESDPEKQRAQPVGLAAARVAEVLDKLRGLQQEASATKDAAQSINLLLAAQQLLHSATAQMKTVPPVPVGVEEEQEARDQHQPQRKDASGLSAVAALRSSLVPVVAAMLEAADNCMPDELIDAQAKKKMEPMQQTEAGAEQQDLLPSRRQYKRWQEEKAASAEKLQELQRQARQMFAAEDLQGVGEAVRETVRLAFALQHTATAAVSRANECREFRQAELTFADALRSHQRAQHAVTVLQRRQQQKQQQQQQTSQQLQQLQQQRQDEVGERQPQQQGAEQQRKAAAAGQPPSLRDTFMLQLEAEQALQRGDLNRFVYLTAAIDRETRSAEAFLLNEISASRTRQQHDEQQEQQTSQKQQQQQQ